ncbi:8039_t:CDS:2, partial [Gigaspora margarita]
FGIIKKTLNLAIAMRRYDELYEIHLNLSKEMEIELITNSRHNILNNDDPVEFATTINNPIVTNHNARTCNVDNTNQDNYKIKNSNAISM